MAGSGHPAGRALPTCPGRRVAEGTTSSWVLPEAHPGVPAGFRSPGQGAGSGRGIERRPGGRQEKSLPLSLSVGGSGRTTGPGLAGGHGARRSREGRSTRTRLAAGADRAEGLKVTAPNGGREWGNWGPSICRVKALGANAFAGRSRLLQLRQTPRFLSRHSRFLPGTRVPACLWKGLHVRNVPPEREGMSAGPGQPSLKAPQPPRPVPCGPLDPVTEEQDRRCPAAWLRG